MLMCCFSRHVDSVSDTRIFARSAEKDGQFLVYSMKLSAKEDLAMVLPLPVPRGSGEDAVRFISLQDYPEFFEDLSAGFPELRAQEFAESLGSSKGKLKVVHVGNFEASYVPAVKDFIGLDERFRLPKGTWDKLPAYETYGFAVFKLKKEAKRVHPMAFEFPRADTAKLFFPTVHIHDGQVHPSAKFDHSLFCQSRHDESPPLEGWNKSPHVALQFMKTDKAQGLLDPHLHCYLRKIRGEQKNEDVWV
jgi:hypothetical protein